MLIAALLLSLQQTAPAPAPQTVILRAARLFDAESGTLKSGLQVRVEGDRIAAVETASDAVAPDALIVDLGDRTLLPGFIDCHTHLCSDL